MFAAPAIFKASKRWNKLWPYSFTEEELDEGEHKPLMSDKEWSIKDIAWLLTIGFAVDLREFVGSAFMMTLYVFLMLIGCTVLHFLICRLFKIKYEYVLLSMVGCIVDGPTASLTAAGGNRKSLINVGLIMGVIAGACGNYVGIFVAYAVKAICGL